MSQISERELVLPSLAIMASRPNGFIATSDLIAELEALFEPAGHDADIIDGRSDTHFSQKVRNLISHRNSTSSFIHNGFAEYDEQQRGLRITDKGRTLVDQTQT